MKILRCLFVPFIVVLITAGLSGLALVLDADVAKVLFSEQGFFEQMSPVLWIFAGLYALWKINKGGLQYLMLGLTFIALALREWDHHKTFTSDSILKINFYKDGFGMEQVFGGIAALVIIGLILATLVILIRYLIAQRGYKTRGGQLLIAGLGMLVLSKLMDRAPSILRGDFNMTLDEDLTVVLLALEEGFEFFCPALILIGVVYKFKSEKSQPLLP